MDSPFSSSSALSTPASGPPRPKVTAGSFAALLPGLLAAVIVGLIYHFIARFLDLLILFPLVVGAITGGILAALVRKNKVRSQAAVFIVALLAGSLCYFTREFADSLHAREILIQTVVADLSAKNPKMASAMEQSFREEIPAIAFFPEFLQLSAQEGISISSTHSSSSSSKTPIKGWGFWGLFALEGLLIIGVTIATATTQAKQPYCEPCDDWYGDEKVVTRVHPDQGEEAVKMVQSGDYAGLGALRGEGTSDNMHCDVKVAKCDKCGVGNLKVVSTKNKSSKTLLESNPTIKEIQTLEEERAKWL